MTQKYFVTITAYGEGQLANAAALGIPLQLTAMAVGDAGGVEPQPSRTQTQLINETYRAQINSLSVDENNINQVIAELVIPETVGGWFVREVGLYDNAGYLFAVANCPPSYKPQMAEGSGRTQVIRIVMVVSSADNITLKIDPAVVIATRNYVDQKFKGREVKAGTGLTGGGDLSSDVTLTVKYGVTAGTAAQGDDSRITGAVQVEDIAQTTGESTDVPMSQKAATDNFTPKNKTAGDNTIGLGKLMREGAAGFGLNTGIDLVSNDIESNDLNAVYKIKNDSIVAPSGIAKEGDSYLSISGKSGVYGGIYFSRDGRIFHKMNDMPVIRPLYEFYSEFNAEVASDGIIRKKYSSSVTGTATFTKSDNRISLDGIGSKNWESGDVIKIENSDLNDGLFSLEIAGGQNSFVVNAAHANGRGSKSLKDELKSDVKVSLLSKWYNATPELGRDWVDMTASRFVGVNAFNTSGRGLLVRFLIEAPVAVACEAVLQESGETIDKCISYGGSQFKGALKLEGVIKNDSPYQVSNVSIYSTFVKVLELR